MSAIVTLIAVCLAAAPSIAQSEDFEDQVRAVPQAEAQAALGQRVAIERQRMLAQQDFQRRLIEQTGPSVVTVYFSVHQRHTEKGSTIEDNPSGSGSGFIVDAEQGWIVTNAHVVSDLGRNGFRQAMKNGEPINYTVLDSRCEIRFYEHSERLEAEVLDYNQDEDLALLKLHDSPLPPIPLIQVKLGDDSKLQKGDIVMVFGAPKGLPDTPNFGSVTNLHMSFYGHTELIQHDSTQNHGNSGGPLFNIDGEVVGVNSYSLRQDNDSSIQGIHFAIGVNRVKRMISMYRKTGRLHYTSAGFEVGPGTWGGMVVTKLIPGSPAAQALQLVKGDLIIGVDGMSWMPPTDAEGATPKDLVQAFRHYIAQKAPGDKITLQLQRPASQTQTIEVTLY